MLEGGGSGLHPQKQSTRPSRFHRLRDCEGQKKGQKLRYREWSLTRSPGKVIAPQRCGEEARAKSHPPTFRSSVGRVRGISHLGRIGLLRCGVRLATPRWQRCQDRSTGSYASVKFTGGLSDGGRCQLVRRCRPSPGAKPSILSPDCKSLTFSRPVVGTCSPRRVGPTILTAIR
jgi:hypothetical protein